jgi:hypothetical protein
MDVNIPNITIELVEEGKFPFYRVIPDDGYLLHDKTLDHAELDESFYPTGNTILGYYPSSRTCFIDYDFENTTTIDGYTAFGNREFFARPTSEVLMD